mmetsp:Transcript_4652/g.12717  ORF Transcript_4652/g.12717 Transcript_4652/m.12717 type:complete len:225 (+) Transcript_4652:1799-2473(+)
MMTSEESSTLYSSPQIRLDWPFSNGPRRTCSLSASGAASSNFSSRSSACMLSSAMLSTDSLGRLRLVLGPNVSLKGCVASRLLRTCLPLSFFSGSSSSCSGSFFSRSSTVYESFTLVAISVRNCSNCFCPTTRVLPNQRRSGWMRVLGRSLDCSSWLMSLPFLSRTARCLYIFSRRVVAASRWLGTPLEGRLVSRLCLGLRVSVPIKPAPFLPLSFLSFTIVMA